MMVNIWHPFDRPAYKDALCLLDVSTMDFSRELQKIQYVFPPEMKFTPQALKGFSNFADVSSEGRRVSSWGLLMHQGTAGFSAATCGRMRGGSSSNTTSGR